MKRKLGFSLVELSIVLVILGLLVGGILAGKSLIRASELRAVGTEYHRYVTAVAAFRDKYFALPGDMANAQSFWGIAHATAATCVTTIGTGTQTCNGDGNSRVTPSTGSNESFRFWQHLVNAGLMEGAYEGVGTDPDTATLLNSPTSRLPGGLWYIGYWGTVAPGNAVTFAATYDNAFELGAISANEHPRAALLKPEELWNVDTKLDDGRPGYGKLIALRWNSCTDAADSADLDSEYALTDTTIQCAVLFRRSL